MASRYGTLSAVSAARRTTCLRVERDAETRRRQHVDVVGPVAHRDGAGERDAGRRREADEGGGLAGPVQDLARQLTRDDAPVELEDVGRQMVDAQVPHQRLDHLA